MKQISKKMIYIVLAICIALGAIGVVYAKYNNGGTDESNKSSKLMGNAKAATLLNNTENGQKDELEGILIDKHCFGMKEPPKDTKMCLMMKSCGESGYGVAIKQKDNTYKFYKFDAQGQKFAMEILKSTKKDKNITILVKGVVDGENIGVSDIVEE